MQSSIDGFVASTNGGLPWTVWNFSDNWTWDESLKQEFNRIFDRIGGIVLSGNMGAEGYIGHWSDMAEQHKGDPRFAFAQKIKDVPKFIFSGSLEHTPYERTTIIKGDLTTQLTTLKKTQSKDLITFGGIRFASALLKAGLVDELQLFVNPAILGNGLSIFKEIVNLKPEVISSLGYSCGITVLKYRLT